MVSVITSTIWMIRTTLMAIED